MDIGRKHTLSGYRTIHKTPQCFTYATRLEGATELGAFFPREDLMVENMDNKTE